MASLCHHASFSPFGAFVLKWRFRIRADTCRTRSYTCRHVPTRADTCRYVSDMCRHVPTRAGHMAGCSSLGFRMTLSCMCGCSVGSCSLRAASHSHLPIMSSEFTFPCILQPSHWMVEITSSIYTFLHVPCYPSIGSLKSCPESIRSCTFCATLPIILCLRILNLYVPIRSVQPSHNSMK
jgi:hypothetical protein